MRVLKVLVMLIAAMTLVSCGNSKFRTYNGPPVTSVQIQKTNRVMYLLNGSQVLESYDIGLGFAPVGPKQFEGDGKTPEGTYTISHRNPNSQYHLSIGISYPNVADIAIAEAAGQPAGGDIFIHGGPTQRVFSRDWTAGCIAVTDREMEDIYAMVKPGTPIQILP